MKIGIIGAGQIGGALTRRLTALGHRVFVANSRGPETLSGLAAETGATAVSIREAVMSLGGSSPAPRSIARISMPAHYGTGWPRRAGNACRSSAPGELAEKG